MQQQFLDLYRAGLRSAADLMKASLEHTERLQQQQLQIVRSALEENTRSSSQLADAKNLDDFFSLNSRLTGGQLERMTEFWSSVWRAAGETQKLMIDQMQAQVGQAKARVRQGYDFTARTSEEAARLAATQLSETASQVRDAAAAQERQAQERRPEARKTA
jgi:phasin family protein